MVKQINSEKDLLIAQNSELKKEVAQSKFDQDMLKSEVERQYTKMQTQEAELKTERQRVARIKASSSDLIKLEEELTFCKEHNNEMSLKVMQAHELMQSQQTFIDEKLNKIMDEKLTVEDENKALLTDIRQKDEIIK